LIDGALVAGLGQRSDRHGSQVTHIDVTDSGSTTRTVECAFGSNRWRHEGDGVLHEAVGTKEGPRHPARLDRTLDGPMNVREAVIILGADDRLLDDVPNADALRGFDCIQFELGLIQRIRAEEEERVAPLERRA
jgi:hypothetical protein